MSRNLHRGVFALLLGAVLVIAGCYETEFTLGPKDKSKVDASYVGDWQVQGENAPTLVVRNIDHHLYYVEWDVPSQKPQRMTAFVTDVKGVPFAHLSEMRLDGTLPEKYVIVRFELKDGKLSVRHLNDKFFEDKAIDSDQKLRTVVAANLENPEMYDKDSSFVATKIAQEQ